MNRTYFDIETAPYLPELLQPLMPQFEAPSNYKDAAKIAAAIEEKKQQWIEKAGLNPLISHVATIAYHGSSIAANSGIVLDECSDRDDKEIIQKFLALCKEGWQGKRQIIGWNIFEFDLPYIMRRAWKHKLDTSCIQLYNNRFWPEYFIDLRVLWGLGQYQCGGNLGEVAQFFGFEGKNGDGAEFARLYYGTEEEKQKAISYAINDVVITSSVGEHMLACGVDFNALKR
jgi:predicted PolB exonuclease-like 3'-5' exonuclease